MQLSDPLQSQKREPAHRKQEQVQKNSKPRKRQKKQSENPFDNLMLMDDQQEQQKQKNGDKNPMQSEWIKPKTTPLTVSVVDHSRINKYYSHKSLQKYIRYLFLKSCPNPMWLSIKRQSQVEHITFLDIEIQNDLFHYWMSKKWEPKTTKQQQQNQQQTSKNAENQIKQSTQPKSNGIKSKEKLKQIEDEDHLLKFLSQYNQPEVKAVFKQSPFLKESYEVWESLLIYDEEAVKEELSNPNYHEQLPNQLTKQLFELYNTYTLSEDQLRYNLYPITQLPVYKDYFKISSSEKQLQPNISQVLQSQPQLDSRGQILPANKILIIDCEMVMSGSNFQLARTSIMNFKGQLIYDQFFKPDSVITNYNTQFSGITEDTLKGVEKRIANLHDDLKNIVTGDTILVGHSLQNDFHAMKFMHDKVIDTSVLYARKNGSKMKLKTLAFNILKRQIQVGSHCSSQDCKATLDLMRVKIEQSQQSSETKTYHMLNQLQENEKKVVLIDNNIDFIKHRKQYLGVHFQDVEYCPENRQLFIGNFVKYFNKNVRNPELVLARIRKSQVEEWEQYYKNIDETIQKLYQASPDKNIFFLNFQVNNSSEIYPRKMEDMLDKRRPFCLLLVKSN